MNKKPLNEVLVDCLYLLGAGFCIGLGFCTAAILFWLLLGALA